MVSDKIVPAYPYEGALYWLFSERGGTSYTGSHGYYKSLYGLNHSVVLPKASALACLFDNILMTPADAQIPRDSSLRVSFGGEYMEWNDEVEELAKRLLQKQEVHTLVSKNPDFPEEFSQFHFMCRTISQMIIADKTNAILVGNSFFNQIYSEVAKELGQIYTKGSTPNSSWSLDLELLDIVGLDFGTADLDKFAAIRQNNEISGYSSEFRKAISEASSKPDLQKQLILLMKKAMEQEQISKHVAGAFETVGSVANVGGLIPVIGSITTAVGITSDASARTARSIETKKQWYLIGTKMQEVILKNTLSKYNAT